MNANQFLAAVNILISDNRKTYAEFPKRMISDYNRENESVKEYNGRQILELLQNADDANSEEVRIHFNTTENKLSIANKGEPFSVGGIESLMLANLSTKTKKIFIGNKGLGFRSILNWADKIFIRTNGCIVEFSPAIAKKEFELAVASDEAKDALLLERGLSDTTIPFPVLAIPEAGLDEFAPEEWTTVIEIFYKKEFENSIQLQLEDCKEEILLFLNNIEKISIVGQHDTPTIFERVRLKENNLTYIQIKQKVWRIETVEDLLPEHLQDKSKREKESFNITVAFQDDLSDKYYKLFNYFPTKLSIYLPCIIHATFELNSSRDYINKSAKNEFIFEQLVELLKNSANKLAEETKGSANWLPFKLLLPTSVTTDSSLIETFYANLQKQHSLLEVFPLIDGNYASHAHIKYYGAGFSKWVKTNDFVSQFAGLLKQEDEVVSKAFPIGLREYSQTEFTTIIDRVSKDINNVNVRAELISHLLQFSIEKDRIERYSILINKQNEVISKRSIAFTPPIESEIDFNTPSFIELDFINKELYSLLVAKYKKGFKQGEPDSREFQRLFSWIANIQPYDSNAVISRIIGGTKEKIAGASGEKASAFIKEMIVSLFDNYKKLKNKTERFNESCPLLNNRNEVKDSRSLFLSSSYRSGALIEKIYESVLNDEHYLGVDPLSSFEGSDRSLVEAFFVWLGVNRLIQVNDIVIRKEAWESEPYLDYAFTKIKKPNPATRFTYYGKAIGMFEKTIAKLSNEKLVCLIIKDEILNQSTIGYGQTGILSYQYGNSYPYISGQPSYISFQLNSLKRFNNYLVENNDLPFVNEMNFNYDDPIFKDYGVSPQEIDFVLVKLGALRSFVDLTTERVYELIKMCGEHQPEHKHTRRLYLQAFEHFRSPRMNTRVSMPDDTLLLAVKNGTKEYRPCEDVYYSDNNILPEKIMQSLWMLDFPKRSGENQVSKYFKVKTLKDLKVEIKDSSVMEHPQNFPFNEWLNKIKPLILCYRLSSLKSMPDKREAASAIKKCSITLVSNVDYTIDGSNYQKLGSDEFVIRDDEFLISVEEYKKMDQFRESSKFCNAFAEMMCILFKVNENKNNYISVFKDKVEFSKSLLHADSLEEYLDEAYTLLGLSQNETGFWEAVCKLKNVELPENIQEEKLLREFLYEKLHFELPLDYKQVDFDEFNSISSYKFLCSIIDRLNISLCDIHRHFPSFPGIKAWHIAAMTDCSIEIEKRYANTIWDELQSKSSKEQQWFIQKRSAFRNWFDGYKWTDDEMPSLAMNVDYKGILTAKVNSEFGITLSDGTAPILFRPEYKTILAKNDEIEKSLTDAQKSLLYFPGNLNEIEGFFKAATSTAINEVATEKHELIELTIEESNLTVKTPVAVALKIKGNSGNRTYDPHTDKMKRKAGRMAEIKVRDSLHKCYGSSNVHWVSGNSDEDKSDDTLGYDFEYRETEKDQWCFLEVKSVTGDSFIISSNEFKVAFEKKERYHLALVKSEKIVIDKDFFKNKELEDTYNSFNSSSLMRPFDFEVFFS